MFKGSVIKTVTEELILSHTTDYDIYNYYLPDYTPGKGCTNSPLRNDGIPSFGVFYADRYSIWMHKDLSTGEKGNCFTFVRDLFSYGTYYEALLRIAQDFGIAETKVKLKPKVKPKPSYSYGSIQISVVNKEFEEYDLEYWDQYKISKDVLNLYKVESVRYLVFSSHFSTWSKPVDKYAYAYPETKDGNICYKIYQPYSKDKWINNYKPGTHSGYEQLPSTGELLIITKSLKDVMSIYATTGIPAIAVQSESASIKQEVFEEYKSRFANLRLLFDNDKAGRKLSKKFSDKYDIPEMIIPEQFKKDYSDNVKEYGSKISKNILIDLI